MQKLAAQRLAEVQKTYPKAMLVDADTVQVIYLINYAPTIIHNHVVASVGSVTPITRQMALRRMLRPAANFLRA
jgi:formate dehydrogenase iron-sulfur subunit